jgi:hypothetical protein
MFAIVKTLGDMQIHLLLQELVLYRGESKQNISFEGLDEFERRVRPVRVSRKERFDALVRYALIGSVSRVETVICARSNVASCPQTMEDLVRNRRTVVDTEFQEQPETVPRHAIARKPGVGPTC